MSKNASNIACPKCGMLLSANNTFCPNCNATFDTSEQFANEAVKALRTDSEASDEEAFSPAFSFDEIDFGITDEELAEAFRPKTAPAANFVASSVAVATAGTATSDAIATSVTDDANAADEPKQAVSELGVDGAVSRDSAESADAENASMANDNPTVIATGADDPLTTELLIPSENTAATTMLADVQAAAYAPANAVEIAAETVDENAKAESSDDETALEDVPTQVTETDDDISGNGGASPDASAAVATTPKAASTSRVKPIAIIGAIIAAAFICGAIAINALPHKVDYTAEYLNKATMEEIAAPTTATANVGDTVTVTAAEIDGYQLNGQDEQSITLQEDAENTVKFMYAQEIPYTVEYLDQDGEAVSPAKVVEKHTVGEKVTEKAPKIDGYELTSSDVFKIKLKEDAKANVITFDYAKKVHYTVCCVDGNNNELTPADSEELIGEGLVGQEVTRNAPPVNGYNLESDDPQTITLTKDESANKITFTYYKPEPEYIQYDHEPNPTPDDLPPIPG